MCHSRPYRKTDSRYISYNPYVSVTPLTVILAAKIHLWSFLYPILLCVWYIKGTLFDILSLLWLFHAFAYLTFAMSTTFAANWLLLYWIKWNSAVISGAKWSKYSIKGLKVGIILSRIWNIMGTINSYVTVLYMAWWLAMKQPRWNNPESGHKERLTPLWQIRVLKRTVSQLIWNHKIFDDLTVKLSYNFLWEEKGRDSCRSVRLWSVWSIETTHTLQSCCILYLLWSIYCIYLLGDIALY